MFPYCKLKENDIKAYYGKLTIEDVEASLEKDQISFTDFMNLVSPAALPLIDRMREKASAVKKMYFGKTIRFYAPLYISNYCVNDCVYCGFRRTFKADRRRLSLQEILTEAEVIRGYGIDSLLLVSGEDPKAVSVSFLEEVVAELKKMFSYISIEIYPMDENGYRRLFNAGVHGLTMFQETYDSELYDKLHSGPKKNYEGRLKAPADGARAGFYNIGLGVLLGLYDWHIEAISMAAHALWLRKHFWKSKVQFSFPRITPVEGSFETPYPVSELELEQLLLAFRIFFRESDLYLSTRENADFRKRMSMTCVSHISAASKVIPGSYAVNVDKGLGQFTVKDKSSVAEIASQLEIEGLEPVFKDWDNCFGTGIKNDSLKTA
ncbi:MAG: thiamine biosynthesis protein ThiH [Lentisphaerae bacterium GWF2_44_16]|nr:MAG: thiamine biosynthesis protein ThiH [Lentisphaerae bacterium GWF2_44_16]